MLNDILMDKYSQLVLSSGECDADFVKTDIDRLIDVNELRALKMSVPFPKDFEFSTSKDECIRRIITAGDWSSETLYRVLEYCVITQPVLQHGIIKVFRNWRCFNGLYAVQHNRGSSTEHAEL